MNWEIIGIWIGAGLTLCIYSFLYKDNPFYKFAEHVYVGVSTGYVICTQFFNALKPLVFDPLRTDFSNSYIVLIPTLLGLLLYTRFFKKIAWVSRYTLAFIIGAGGGIYAPNSVQAYLIRHTGSTITNLFNPGAERFFSFTGQSFLNIEGIIIFIVVVSIMVYFFFSVPRKGIIKPTAKLGIIFLMVYFGGAFGYTVMGRVSLAIGRIQFLLLEWLGLG